MFDIANSIEIYENFTRPLESSVYSCSFLTVQEASTIQNEIKSTLFICEQIPSLVEYGYLSKKKALILQALKGLQVSKTHNRLELIKICNPERDGRILSEDIGVYKKYRNIQNEALVWELSVILGCDHFIAPSLPIYIYDGEATFQPFSSVSSIMRFIKDGQEMPLSISLEDYWILALYTFLIGHSDLNGNNLHFEKTGYFLVDNDCSFPSFNRPISLDGRSLSVPFQNVLLDFDYSRKILSDDSYESVKAVLNKWRNREKDLENFFSLSPLSQSRDFQLNEQAFWERWRKILDSELSPDIDLRTFIQTIFPEHFKQIDIAQQLASKILDKSVGPMSALHLLSAYIRYCSVDQDTYHEVYKWIKLNHTY
jgi:hypothetical protein